MKIVGDRMKQEQIMFYESVEKKQHEFLDQILENCYIDDTTGKFYCKRCKNLVHIDWHRNLACCSVHIISRFGIAYLQELPKVHV